MQKIRRRSRSVSVFRRRKTTDITKPSIKIFKQIGRRINQDTRYRNKILSRYSFAKKELAKAGIPLDIVTHRKARRGYLLLSEIEGSIKGKVEGSDGDIKWEVEVGVSWKY